MKIRNISKSLATLAAIASLNFGCASMNPSPYKVKFERQELPAGFLYCLSAAKKKGDNEIKVVWPEVKEVPENQRLSKLDEIENAMSVYDSDKIKKLGLKFYVMKVLAPSKEPGEKGEFKEIAYLQRRVGSKLDILRLENISESVHKSMFLNAFIRLSDYEQEKVRATYSHLRHSKEQKSASSTWECHIADQWAKYITATNSANTLAENSTNTAFSVEKIMLPYLKAR